MKSIHRKFSINDRYYEPLERQVEWRLLKEVCRQVRQKAIREIIDIKYELNDRSKEEFGQEKER